MLLCAAGGFGVGVTTARSHWMPVGLILGIILVAFTGDILNALVYATCYPFGIPFRVRFCID